MHPDLERIVVEDEVGRAAVDAATVKAQEGIEAARQELAASRQARRDDLERQLHASIDAIEREIDAEVERRRSRRALFERERLTGAGAAFDEAVDAFVSIVRDGPGEESPS